MLSFGIKYFYEKKKKIIEGILLALTEESKSGLKYEWVWK